ncbi:MAG: hypothetical protein JWO15_3642 [Sphingomonadales bacterium]|nr:hypothetical protein [Sphingomonadales bacterium]
MDQRLKLHAILEQILGSAYVYFQPPSNIKMKYPCIIYHRDAANTRFADNSPYRHTKRYAVTIIDGDPDSPIPDKVAELPLCSFDRAFVADNLNHDVYSLYF